MGSNQVLQIGMHEFVAAILEQSFKRRIAHLHMMPRIEYQAISSFKYIVSSSSVISSFCLEGTRLLPSLIRCLSLIEIFQS